MRLISLVGLAALSSLGAGQTAKIQIWEKPISPGLMYRMQVDTQTPLILHALRISSKTPGLTALPELAGHTVNEEGTVKGRLSPGQMAAQSSAIAAINGDYFSFTQGAPIGLMVRSGELIDTPFKARSTFGWGPSTAAIATCTTSVELTPEDGSATKVDGVNQPCGQNQIELYTPAEGTAQFSGPHTAVLINVPQSQWTPNCTVDASVDSLLPVSSDAKVPEGKAILVGTGDKVALLNALRPGEKIRIQIRTEGFDWEKIENVIGGGPVLVKDGKVAVNAEAEGFPASFYAKRHPRTMIGKTQEGDIWLVVVDGRQEISSGATLEEGAKLMIQLGCSDALNLDGGGSTNLSLLGLSVNRPSDGAERPVSTGILVMGPKVPVYVGELKIVAAASVGLAGKPSVHLTLNGSIVPNADVIWSAQGAAWIDQGGSLHPLELGKVTVRASAYGKVLSATISVVEKAPGRKRRRKTPPHVRPTTP